MVRFALMLMLATQAASALAAGGTCTVAGTALTPDGRPLPNVVVRLIDLHTGRNAFAAVDAHSSYEFAGIDAADLGRYRIDILSAPTVVTGSKIPTRSILGMSNAFGCGAGLATRQDVRAEVY